VLASHLLDEVEKVCTHVAILQRGNLLMAGDVKVVLTNEDMVELGVAEPQHGRLQEVLSGWPDVREMRWQEGLLQVFFINGVVPSTGELNRFCFDKGLLLTHLQLRKRSLESKFMELTTDQPKTVK
jgi:ABC-2 type transport system ATP-binding protein